MSERNSEAFVTSFATLDELVGHTWYRLGGPLATTREMAELTVEANGTYNVVFDSGCESAGDLWGYREESSPAVSYVRTESVLWLMEGCESSFGDARVVNVDLLDGHLFLNGAAFGLREDHSTNQALGPPTDGVSLHASYAPPTAAGERTVFDLRVVNDRSDSIEVSSVDVNTTSVVANGEDDGYSTSTRSPDTTSTIERTVPSGERHELAVEVSMPEGAGAIVTAFVRFAANGHDKTVSVSVNPLFAP